MTWKQHSRSHTLCLSGYRRSDLQRNSKNVFRFFIIKTITENSIKVISNKGWLHNNQFIQSNGGEQPIDVAYTILALAKFNDT
jgi:hypothetical protein